MNDLIVRKKNEKYEWNNLFSAYSPALASQIGDLSPILTDSDIIVSYARIKKRIFLIKKGEIHDVEILEKENSNQPTRA